MAITIKTNMIKDQLNTIALKYALCDKKEGAISAAFEIGRSHGEMSIIKQLANALFNHDGANVGISRTKMIDTLAELVSIHKFDPFDIYGLYDAYRLGHEEGVTSAKESTFKFLKNTYGLQ